MPNESKPAPRRIVILADEAAEWRVAGLRQLERLQLTIAEWARENHEAPEIVVCSENPGEGDLVITTHLFLYRHSFGEWLERADQPDEASADRPWEYLENHDAIPGCERRFLAQMGKSQDGLVSRYLNRPISRTVSRQLLRWPIAPTTWSVAIFVLPLIAAIFLLRGTYWGFVSATVIFQLYSILDGCDGEIARAKFQQSDRGRRIDSFCDLLGNLLLAFFLGIGLARQSTSWIYLAEGIATTLFVILGEGIVFLRRSPTATVLNVNPKLGGALYQRHHEFFARSGLARFGDRFAWWLVQLTKRDLAILAFVILALVGWPALILHLLFAVAAISAVVAGNAFLRRPVAVMAEAPGLVP